MKIALCISGLLRNYKYTQPLLKKWILDPLQPDVFFYGYTNKEGLFQNTKDLQALYTPTAYELREHTPAEEEYLRNLRSRNYKNKAETCNIDWFLGHAYNLYGVGGLKKRHEARNNFKYDLVIRCRCDIFYHRTPSAEELELAQKDNVGIVPTEWDFNCVRPYAKSNDFIICNSATFDKYSSLWDQFDSYYDEGCLMHHESMMGYHLDKQGINRIPCPTHYWYEPPAGMDIPSQNRRDF